MAAYYGLLLETLNLDYKVMKDMTQEEYNDWKSEILSLKKKIRKMPEKDDEKYNLETGADLIDLAERFITDLKGRF